MVPIATCSDVWWVFVSGSTLLEGQKGERIVEFDFGQTVAESAIGGAIAALLVALVAVVRLAIKAHTEYRMFGMLSQRNLREAGKGASRQSLAWHQPVIRFESGCNTTWAYEQTAPKQMNWWSWLRKVVWYSLLYKRSTAEPRGLSGRN